MHHVGKLQCANSVLNAKKQFLAAVKERVMSAIAKGPNEAVTCKLVTSSTSIRSTAMAILLVSLPSHI